MFYSWLVPVFGLIAPTAFADQPPIESYASLKPIFDSCAACHATSMDLRAFPFVSRFASQEDLVHEMLRRFRLPTWQRMPPPNVVPQALSDDEIRRIESWLEAGLPAE